MWRDPLCGYRPTLRPSLPAERCGASGPRPPNRWSEQTQAAFELAMREYDSMHES
jgi:hypothetical protein